MNKFVPLSLALLLTACGGGGSTSSGPGFTKDCTDLTYEKDGMTETLDHTNLDLIITGSNNILDFAGTATFCNITVDGDNNEIDLTALNTYVSTHKSYEKAEVNGSNNIVFYPSNMPTPSDEGINNHIVEDCVDVFHDTNSSGTLNHSNVDLIISGSNKTISFDPAATYCSIIVTGNNITLYLHQLASYDLALIKGSDNRYSAATLPNPVVKGTGNREISIAD